MVYTLHVFKMSSKCNLIATYLVPVLLTLYIHRVLKFKEIIPEPKG